MKILTATEMQAVDRWTAEEFGVSLETLMEAAGGAVAAFFGASQLLTHKFLDAVAFVPLGVLGEVAGEASAALLPAEPLRPHPHEDKAGTIEIALPNGARVSVDAFVNEKALSRVLRAMKAST